MLGGHFNWQSAPFHDEGAIRLWCKICTSSLSVDRTKFFLNEVSIWEWRRLAIYSGRRTTILWQTFHISLWPTINWWLIGQMEMYNISILLKIGLSLSLFLYCIHLLCLCSIDVDYIYEKRSSFVRWLVYRATSTEPDPPSLSFPHLLFSFILTIQQPKSFSYTSPSDFSSLTAGSQQTTNYRKIHSSQILQSFPRDQRYQG